MGFCEKACGHLIIWAPLPLSLQGLLNTLSIFPTWATNVKVQAKASYKGAWISLSGTTAALDAGFN